MTLPTFVGIGAHRSGSSWLYQQLKNHPDIFMSERKEINFFDQNYQFGIEWYEKFFPVVNESSNHQIYGEISPGYLYTDEAADRIARHLPDCKLIAILRNPVNRCYSQYRYSIRNNEDQRNFTEFLEQTEAIKISLYGKQIERFLKSFPSENILFLIFEEVVSNPPTFLRQIGDFLGVDGNKFLLEDSLKKVNSSSVFRFNYLFGLTRNYFKKLRKQGIYVEPITSVIKKIYFSLPENILYSKMNKTEDDDLDLQTYQDLFKQFEADINQLEVLLGRDLSLWKIHQNASKG